MQKKALFIDRDGTIIKEPPVDFQVDSLAKLEFYPGAIGALSSIAGLDWELVMVSNQDGLGTGSFPKEDFWPPHNLMLETLKGEGVEFSAIHIDPSFPHENKPTRKPGTGMLTSYMTGEYDLSSSYVIGDRITDVQLAKNLGAKAILLRSKSEGIAMVKDAGLEDVCVLITDSWTDIYAYLRFSDRYCKITRNTSETSISVELDLDNSFESKISTGLNFFDHMLYQIVHHAGVALKIDAKGDLEVDEHHTMEDVAIVLGEAFYKTLGSKRGIERYGYCLPMDECRASVLIDFGGRISFDWDVEFKREMIGDVPAEMFKHFFKSFSESARCNLHIKAEGENEHHKIEGVFKAFARSVKMAIRRNPFQDALPSSKGVL